MQLNICKRNKQVQTTQDLRLAYVGCLLKKNTFETTPLLFQ